MKGAAVEEVSESQKGDAGRKCSEHEIRASCLKVCTQWSLGVQVYNQESQSKSQMIKLPFTGIAMRSNGTMETGPVPFTNDILDAMIDTEKLNQCSHFPIHASASQMKLSSFNGFQHPLNTVSPVIELPLKNLNRLQECIDILNPVFPQDITQQARKCESLYCLEFELREKLPL